ncbi:MAG: response regulator transcription factor [Phototrophicaceae bacterium]
MSAKKIRIAIVDDKQVVRDGLSLFLKIFQDLELAATASNGKEILALCATQHFDVVLMDIVMPEMNGIEATQLITKNYPHIAVIGLTSIYGDVDQRTAMLDAGAVACLPKNASIQEIEQAIRRSKQTML